MCGGCRGEGGYSSRCITQPGSLWRRLADMAEDLGDAIGSNDPEAANAAYGMAAKFKRRWQEILSQS
jgi:hypothetical protein